MDKRLLKFLRNDVLIAQATGTKTSAGEIEHGVPISYKGRVEFREVVLKDATGSEVYARSRIYFNGDVPIEEEDLITLPSGSVYPVLQIRKLYDEKGVLDHKVVYLSGSNS